MQRRHARACAHGDILGHRRYRRAGHRRVGEGAAKSVEMAFRRPDRAEAVGVGEFRAFQQQVVFLRALAIVIAPIHEAEIHMPIRDAHRAFGHHGAILVAHQHNLETARQCPEQFQHRNVKAERGDRQPHAGRVMADAVIHTGKEIGDIAMFDHHPLGRAGRA